MAIFFSFPRGAAEIPPPLFVFCASGFFSEVCRALTYCVRQAATVCVMDLTPEVKSALSKAAAFTVTVEPAKAETGTETEPPVT